MYDFTTSADAYVLRRTSALAVETVRALRRPGERWLDLGCGPGHATALLANEGDSIVGADADPRMLYAARERCDELELVAAHAESLPFASGSFHGVVADILDRLSRCPGRMLFGSMPRAPTKRDCGHHIHQSSELVVEAELPAALALGHFSSRGSVAA